VQERFGLRHVHVIARQDARVAPALEELPEISLDLADAALENESDREIDLHGPHEVREQMREQRVDTAADQGRVVRGTAQQRGFGVRGRGLIPDEQRGRQRRIAIASALGDDVADAAARIGNVSRIARDHVQVQMEDGLTCRRANIHAEVERIRRRGVLPLEDRCAGAQGCLDQLGALLRSGIEEARNVALRDEERVAGRHWEAIPQAENELARVKDAAGVGITERTGGICHRLSSLPTLCETSRRPESPTVTHSRQRHWLIRRRAKRNA